MGCLGSKDRLTKEDMDFLKSHTRYDEQTIKEWYKGFKVRDFFSSFSYYLPIGITIKVNVEKYVEESGTS